MKKYQIILTVFCVFIVNTACNGKTDDDLVTGKLELSKENVKLSNAAGSATIQITSNGDWSVVVESDKEWLSVSPTKGSGDGSVRIMATENSQSESRNGKVSISQTVNGSTTVKEVAVEQLGADPDILVSYSSDVIPAEGCELEISITANVDWEIVIDETYNWISLLETGTNYCKILIAPNYDVDRVGRVTVKSTGAYSITKVVEFTQAASNAVLSIGQDEFIVPYKNQTIQIPVDLGGLNTQYGINCDADWITWDETASTNELIVLKLADNDASDFPRTTELTVTNVHLQEKVQIFQYGKPNPRIGDDTSADVLAFPGAEGGGRFTTGGRGGIICRVTSLEDNASGSAPRGTLRWAVERTGKRIIVFDVSGTIELKRGININRGDVSILGQTAPGDGITLKNYDVAVAADNVLIRFLRVRPGDQMGGEPDAISGRYFKTGIIDHVSGSWCVDEGISFYGVKDFTLQWSISSESLNNSSHSKGAHGYGGMFSGDNASCHHILFAHHSSRTPRISALSENQQPENPNDNQGYSDIRNFVCYNWNGGGLGAHGGENNPFNWVNQYYKAGPATGTGYKSWRLMLPSTTSRIYATGSIAPANPATASDNWNHGIWDQMTLTEAEKNAIKMNEPHPYSKVTTHTAQDGYDRVLKYAGASLRRDAVDKRIVNEVFTGTYTYRGSVSGTPGIVDKILDVGGVDGAYPYLKSLPALIDTDEDGIPDIWEDAYGLDKNNPNDALTYNIDNLGRYSNLEVYFHNLVQHIVYEQNIGGVQTEKLQ